MPVAKKSDFPRGGYNSLELNSKLGSGALLLPEVHSVEVELIVVGVHF